MIVRQSISSDLKREQIEIILKLEVPSAKINQISSFDVVVDLLKIFALLFLSSLLYWFSAKVGVLCQGRCHFPDDLAQSVHQPPTLVSTFLALTLMIYFHYIENESENESEIDNESVHQPTTLVSTFLSSINIVDSAK